MVIISKVQSVLRRIQPFRLSWILKIQPNFAESRRKGDVIKRNPGFAGFLFDSIVSFFKHATVSTADFAAETADNLRNHLYDLSTQELDRINTNLQIHILLELYHIHYM